MSLQSIKREALKMGATVERSDGGRYCTYQIEAPIGKQWVDGGCASLRVEWIWGDTAWKQDAFQEALSRMSYGLEEAAEVAR